MKVEKKEGGKDWNAPEVDGLLPLSSCPFLCSTLLLPRFPLSSPVPPPFLPLPLNLNSFEQELAAGGTRIDESGPRCKKTHLVAFSEKRRRRWEDQASSRESYAERGKVSKGERGEAVWKKRWAEGIEGLRGRRMMMREGGKGGR